MSEPEPKGTSKLPASFPEVDGFDTKKNRPGSNARPDPGAVTPVDPVPNAGTAKPDGRQRKSHRLTQPLTEPGGHWRRTPPSRRGSSSASIGRSTQPIREASARS
jgi:hypothetical protein